ITSAEVKSSTTKPNFCATWIFAVSTWFLSKLGGTVTVLLDDVPSRFGGS
ncbi:MAG: hypothetical protein RL700_1582, partial [Pseudomonadota bacterium]